MSIRVIKPGLLTTVQDWGRIGSQSIGFNVSGVMDRRSYRLANFLVGNYTDEAVLEMTALGGSFVFLESNYIAITGADMGANVSNDFRARGRHTFIFRREKRNVYVCRVRRRA